MNPLGERIAAARRSKHLTQPELAAIVGVTQQTVSRWEKGTRIPDIVEIAKLSDALEESAVDLYDLARRTKEARRDDRRASRAAQGSSFMEGEVRALQASVSGLRDEVEELTRAVAVILAGS